jgi:hypothetical protein
MIVQGEVGIGDGWWLVLEEPYEGDVNEEGGLILSQARRLIMPQSFSFDAESVPETPRELLDDLVSEAKESPELADLGPITGTGWEGHLFREPIDPESGEYQLLATLAANGTILNLAVRYIGPEAEGDAREVIVKVVNDPETREEMNAQIRSQTEPGSGS